MTDAQHDPLIGKTLGDRFRVTRRIAEGGMGAIYEAEQTALGRKVAIKVLHAHLANDAEIVMRFEREARATTAIGHPNIVDVIDFGTLDDGSKYLVLEFLDGRDLGKLLREVGPLPLGRAARLAMQIAAGVGAAHDKGIVHRDLKPENAIVLDEGQASEHLKVVDFGISKIRENAAGPDARTRTGTAIGTPYFMAPEQAQGKREVDHRADIYSLGVILFRLLTGHHPFDDASYPMLIVKICTEEAPSITTWRRDLPPAMVSLIARMLAKEPIERPQSMAVVADELAAFTSDARTPELTGAPGTSASTARVLTKEALAATMASSPGRRGEDDEEEHHATLRKVGVGGGDMAGTGGVGTPIKVAIGVMAVAAIGLGAWALFGAHGPDAPVEQEENAPLPTAGAPVVHALHAANYGTDEWGWLNPRPRAMPTWFGIDVAGGGVLAMVGERGAAAHLVDGLLLVWRTGTDAQLEAVRWTGSGQALAAGEHGTLVRLTDGGPHPLETGTTETLHALAVVSPTTTIVVGDAGTVIRISGETATRMDLGVTGNLLGAHARRGDAWIVGEGGVILHVTDAVGGHFSREHGPTEDTLRAIGGCDRGALYAVGDDGTIARRHADGSWHGLRLPSDTHEAFTSVTCDHGYSAIVGGGGLVVLASGDQTMMLQSGYDGTWHGVGGADGESAWIVGGGGQVASIEGGAVATRMDGPTVPLRDIGSIAGAMIAVGEWGNVARQTAAGFVLADSPTDAGLGAMAMLDEGHLVAVGDGGTVVVISYDAITTHDGGTRATLHDVVSEGGALLVVGTEGTILRGTPDALAATRISDVGDLWSVTGTPSDAIVVGDHGFVAHLDATSHRAIECGEGVPSLRAVMRAGATAYAAGEAGAVVRIDESGCTRETVVDPTTSTLPTLNAIGLGPRGLPLAVGDEGASYERQADGTWTLSDLNAGRSSLRGIERIDGYVYVVGTGGTILRRVVVDGT